MPAEIFSHAGFTRFPQTRFPKHRLSSRRNRRRDDCRGNWRRRRGRRRSDWRRSASASNQFGLRENRVEILLTYHREEKIAHRGKLNVVTVTQVLVALDRVGQFFF